MPIRNEGAPGADEINSVQSALMVRSRARGAFGALTITGNLQAYGAISGYDPRKLHTDEVWAGIDFARRWSLVGGAQRYSSQYSFYWNPTFPVQHKTDLFRPD